MNKAFAKTLKELRKDKGLSQQELADRVFVDRSSVASWETGRRIPDAILIARICGVLNVDPDVLIGMAGAIESEIVVMVVDDEEIILDGAVRVVKKTMPEVQVAGFNKVSEAVAFAKTNRVSLALLDIHLRAASGFDLCKELLAINPTTNVIFLTSHMEYSYDAWDTGACGFMVKPLTEHALMHQMSNLRHPLSVPGTGEEVD